MPVACIQGVCSDGPDELESALFERFGDSHRECGLRRHFLPRVPYRLSAGLECVEHERLPEARALALAHARAPPICRHGTRASEDVPRPMSSARASSCLLLRLRPRARSLPLPCAGFVDALGAAER